LPNGTIQWGKKLARAEIVTGGAYALTFSDGSAACAKILVGADGAWSKVRPLLSQAEPAYTGTTFVETYLHDVDTRHIAAAEAVGSGALFALAPGKGFFAHREPNDVIHAYVALNRSKDWIARIDFDNHPVATAHVAAEFKGWARELTALITDSDIPPNLRMLYALPVGHRWERRRGVTLIGDAAHLALPAGEGANLAMLDGAELGQAIAEHGDDVETAFSTYEESMFPRSKKAAAEAKLVLDLGLGERAPYGLLEFFAANKNSP
jgi:2-polyprenyl-6-methoxyphenol hydroxylase-like FAD-dependent oxidoreductase